MEKWIILKMQEKSSFSTGLAVDELSQIAVVDEHNELIIFNSLDEAYSHQEKYTISGQCVELPIY